MTTRVETVETAVNDGQVIDIKSLEPGPPNPIPNPHATAKPSSVAGRGLFASKDLARGDLIISEKPCSGTVLKGRWHDPSTKELEDLIANNRKDPETGPALDFIAGTDATTGTTKLFSAEMFRTHNFCIEDHNVYQNRKQWLPYQLIFRNLSLANHSCSPNAHASWRSSGKYDMGGQLCLYALCPIAEGEEIFIAYADWGEQGTWRTRDERQKSYMKSWNFNCHCPVCTSRDREQSRERRAELFAEYEELEAQIDTAPDNSSVLHPVDKVWEQCKLRLEALKLMHVDLGGSTRNNEHLLQIPPKMDIHMVKEYEDVASHYVDLYRASRHKNRRCGVSDIEIAVKITAKKLYDLSTIAHHICHGSDTPGAMERELENCIAIASMDDLNGTFIDGRPKKRGKFKGLPLARSESPEVLVDPRPPATGAIRRTPFRKARMKPYPNRRC